PDLVVANFGGNDAVDIKLPGRRHLEYGTPEWEAGYRGKVTDLIGIATAGGARTIMIGMPIMRQLKFRETIKRLNRLTQQAAEEAGGWYVDQLDLSATPDGEYREEVIIDGKRRLMRMADGIHYTTWGGQHVVRRLMPRIERLVRLVPRDPAHGAVEE